jgi:AcrR family transcriptional regulator
LRKQGAEARQERILQASRALFSRRGIDNVSVAEIARRARVSPSTVYELFKSKAGILRALMSQAIFGARYQAAAFALEKTDDPLAQLKLTATLARTIYENESLEMGLMRGASMFSPELRTLEREFEDSRFELQRRRVELLFERSIAREGLSVEDARQILWMYTSRDIYRMLVVERHWTPERYESWLAETLTLALTHACT